jgi:hypothetical protein
MDIIRERLANQFLTGKPLATPVEVVRRLGAVQAQDIPGAKWAVGMRTRNATNADVEHALARGEILRTHVLRPTWHFVTREDIRWMLALTGSRITAVMNVYGKKLGLTPAVYRRSRAVIEKALGAGTHLTRTELTAALRAARVDTSTERLMRLIMSAETEGVICSGAVRGKHQTYALLDQRAPQASVIDRDEALSRLALLYFRGRGPATVHDFSWWSGLTVGDARRGIEVSGRALTAIEVGDRTMWMVEREAPAAPAVNTAHLLPNYDEYFIGHRDRSAIGRRLKGVHLVTGGDASITHVVIVGGELVGGWRRVPPGAGTTANVTFAVRVSRDERALVERERARFASFFA